MGWENCGEKECQMPVQQDGPMDWENCGEKECQKPHLCAAFTTSLNLIKASYAAVASDGLTMLNKLLGTWGPVILLKALKTSMTWLLGTDAITLPSAAFTAW